MLELLNHPLLSAFSIIILLISIFIFILKVCLCSRGIINVLYRIGMGLAKRKLAIFASIEGFCKIKDILSNSQLFSEKNIIQINYENLKKAEIADIYIVYWKDSEKSFEEILEVSRYNTPIIVYAPSSDGYIPAEKMKILSDSTNTILVNFKGRLINDIIVSLITAGYSKKI